MVLRPTVRAVGIEYQLLKMLRRALPLTIRQQDQSCISRLLLSTLASGAVVQFFANFYFEIFILNFYFDI